MRWHLQWNSDSPPLVVELLRKEGSQFTFSVDGEELSIELKSVFPYSIETDDSCITLEAWNSSRWRGAGGKTSFDIQPLTHALNSANHKPEIRSQMPGRILKVFVKAGDQLNPGSPVMIIEAMKMENEVRAFASSIVKAVHVSEGQSIESNTLLIDFENL